MDKVYLTPELVRAIIEDERSNYFDLDALWFMVGNAFGLQSPLLDEISAAIDQLQFPVVEITEPLTVDAVDFGRSFEWIRAEADYVHP